MASISERVTTLTERPVSSTGVSDRVAVTATLKTGTSASDLLSGSSGVVSRKEGVERDSWFSREAAGETVEHRATLNARAAKLSRGT
jgi:hypothetical protein